MIIESSLNAPPGHLNQDLNFLLFGEPPATLGDIIPQKFLNQSEFEYSEFLNVAGIVGVADDDIYPRPVLEPQTPVIPGVDIDVIPPPAPELPVLSPHPPAALLAETMAAQHPYSLLRPPLRRPLVVSLILLSALRSTFNSYPHTYSNTTTPEYQRPSSVQSRTTFTSTPMIPTPPTYAPAPSIRLAPTEATFHKYSEFWNSYPALYSSSFGNMDGIQVGCYQDPFTQQQMVQTVAALKLLPQQGQDPPIYMPPARPLGAVRRKRQDRTSPASPYPDAFGRQAINSNTRASGSTAQGLPWMDSLQRNQRQSGEFIPSYALPGDPMSPQTTSGGITENLANAKEIHKPKGSNADQKQLDKKAHDRRRRGAISAAIEDLSQKVPQRPRTGDNCQLDTLEDVLYALNIPIPARITKLPPAECEKRTRHGATEAIRRKNVRSHIEALASGLGLNTTVQLQVLQNTLGIVEERINAGLLVSRT